MITPFDLICDPELNKSRYRYVNDKTESGKGGDRPFQAVVGTNPHYKGERTSRFIGPPRKTAYQAAQDACVVLNLSTIPERNARARRTFGQLDRSLVS